jgi:hypothetical protein
MNAKPISRSLIKTAALLTLALPAAQAQINFTRLDAYAGAAGNGEILGYSSLDYTVASTLGGTGVELLNLSASGQLSARGIIDLSGAFAGIGDTLASASSVALDPLGRGFGVVSLVPTLNGTNLGKIGLFDFRRGSFASLTTLDVGYHPDSVSFSAEVGASNTVVVREGRVIAFEDYAAILEHVRAIGKVQRFGHALLDQ